MSEIEMKEERQINYNGFKNYVYQRVRDLTIGEKKKILSCTALDLAFEKFKIQMKDDKNKLGLYNVYLVKNDFGEIGVTSISKLPIFFVRKIGAGESLTLFKISKCLSNFRRPMTLFQSVVKIEPTVAYLLVKYAFDPIKYLESYIKKQDNRLVRINYALRRKTYHKYINIDPLDFALESCLQKYIREHEKNQWYFTHDILKYLKITNERVLLADGEENEGILIEGYNPSGCPSFSLTMINLDVMYVAHSSDVG